MDRLQRDPSLSPKEQELWNQALKKRRLSNSPLQTKQNTGNTNGDGVNIISSTPKIDMKPTGYNPS